MSNITNKTYCILTNYGNKIFITKEQYDYLYKNYDNFESIKIKDVGIIAKKYVVMIAPASQIIENEKKKEGMWKCEYGYWHKKGEQCGHGIMNKLETKVINKSIS